MANARRRALWFNLCIYAITYKHQLISDRLPFDGWHSKRKYISPHPLQVCGLQIFSLANLPESTLRPSNSAGLELSLLAELAAPKESTRPDIRALWVSVEGIAPPNREPAPARQRTGARGSGHSKNVVHTHHLFNPSQGLTVVKGYVTLEEVCQT